MAISTDATVLFYGTRDTLTTTGSSTTDGSVTQANSTVWTNDDDAPMASFDAVLTFGTGPTANSSVDLFARLMNINSTNDEDAPQTDFQQHYLGSFVLDNVTSAQYRAIGPIVLPNMMTSQDYQFYIQNNGGQTLSANWSLFITPIAYGPHA